MCPAVTGFCSFACTTLYLKYLSYKDTFNFKVFLGKKISVKIFVITHPRLNLLLTHLVPHSVLYPYRKTHVLLICTYLIFISTFHGCLISVCSTLVECLTCSRLLITIYWMNLLNELSKGKYCLPGKIKVFIFPVLRHIPLSLPFSAAVGKGRVKCVNKNY